MNYIKHLNGVYVQFSKDNRLNPTHISLYIALFQFWNYNRFPNDFYINREEIMKFSKIGSNTTYHRCIKELSHWKYILYSPSHNPFKGSKVKLFNFSTSDKQALYLDSTINEQALVSNTNVNKHNINFIKLEAIAKEKLILDFFKKENYPELEAKKFFNHYQGIGWKVGGKTKMVDWQATARSWMLKAEEMNLSVLAQSRTNSENNLPLDHFQDNLHTNQNKNYDEPL
ncbi:hypothetical protein [Lutibacter maritimus]|uniref:Uncharacterized protein n=1 Tax=Lutibacter maritimus TaxID=593133 RepID=A0A1I6Q0S3_9FLAO|nr:hypothetical protein [Lutibacter maritimus]SFS46024.1 hypothetical protein SAMN04488006_1388 [Lutibacter maritimus]